MLNFNRSEYRTIDLVWWADDSRRRAAALWRRAGEASDEQTAQYLRMQAARNEMRAEDCEQLIAESAAS